MINSFSFKPFYHISPNVYSIFKLFLNNIYASFVIDRLISILENTILKIYPKALMKYFLIFLISSI